MFIIQAKRKHLALISKVLEDRGLKVEKTNHPEYICLYSDPRPSVPDELKTFIKVTETPDEMPFIPRNKQRKKDRIKPNVPAVIIKGAFKGHPGIIKSVANNRCEIELSVFGRIIKATMNIKDIKAAV